MSNVSSLKVLPQIGFHMPSTANQKFRFLFISFILFTPAMIIFASLTQIDYHEAKANFFVFWKWM